MAVSMELLVLAAGRDLYSQVNSAEYSNQRETETGFFVAFSEILSTHPNLPKRVAALGGVRAGSGVASLPTAGSAVPVGR
jgi:Zn-dependent protease with chaperone function